VKHSDIFHLCLDILILFVRVYVQGSGFFSKTSIAVSLCKQDLTRCAFSRMGGQRKKTNEQKSPKKKCGRELERPGIWVKLHCSAKMDALHIPSNLKKRAA